MTAFNVYDGDGTQTQFPITFDYFVESEIEVFLWDSAVSNWQQKTNTVDYNIGSNNINFVAAPAVPATGITGNVLILRKTDVGVPGLTDPKAVFTPGTPINAADLNINQTQVLRAVQDLRDTNMSVQGRIWYDQNTQNFEAQETRLYSDLNMTGREISNVDKINVETLEFTQAGVKVETDIKDIPTQAQLALKDDITNVDAKLAANVVNENAKLALKEDISAVNAKLALNVTNEDTKLALKEDITSVNTKLEQNVINEDAKLALKDDIASVDQKLVLNVAAEDAKLALKEDTSAVNTKLALKDDITNVDAKLATKADLSGGKLLASQLPDIAISDFLGAVSSQAVMLTLTGQRGDWCSRTDDGKVYIISGTDPTLISDWTVITYPAAPVTSVAGRTGVVTLSTSDISGLGTAAVTASTDYATAAQGALADSATQPGDLTTVAISGDYADLTNKPTLGTAAATDSTAYATAAQGTLADSATQPGDLSTVATSGSYNDLTNKPTLGTAAATDATAYATAAQGTKADSATQPADLAVVQADVDQNEADADAAIAAVQADVDQNEADADTAIAAVQADVDANEAAALTARNAIQADVDQNEADSDAAELALSNRLNTLEADPTTASAVAAVQADVDLNEANLATVATSGAYSDLSGKPTLGTAAATDATAYATAAQGTLADSATQPGDLHAVATSGSYNDLSGKPTIPTIDPDTVIDANYVATDNNFTNADHTKLDGIAAGAEVNVVTSVASKTGAVTLVKGDVGLGNVNNTSDANKPVSTAVQTALNAKADLTAGKLNTAQLPDIAIAEYKGNVSNQTAMLAITGEKGDWVIRNDDSKVYVITGSNPSVASDWTALSYPAGFSGVYNDLSGKPTLGTAAATASTDYATAAQGTLADSATQPGDLASVATSGSYNDLSSKPTIPTNNNQLTNGAGYVTSNTQLSNEAVQDIVGAMVSGNTESGITVTYQDGDGTLDFSVASQTDQNFTNADHTKLNGIETGATADQTAAEILTAIKTVHGDGSGLDADTLDGLDSTQFLRSDTAGTFSGDLTSSGSARILLKKTDNNVSDHIQFYNGTTRVGEIGCQDTSFLRINQETAKNIYTPRYMRADAGFYVDGTSKGINGSGNFIGGTIAGASDYSTLLRSNANDEYRGGTLNINSDSNDGHYVGWGLEYKSNAWRHTNASSWGHAHRNSAGILDIYVAKEAGTADSVATYRTLRIGGSSQLLQYDGHNIWHAGNGGAGTGLDADKLDGQQGSYYLDYNNLNNTPSIPTNYLPLSGGTLTGTLTLGSNTINDVEDIYLRDKIYHDGDTDTYIQFQDDNRFRVVCQGAEVQEWGNNYTLINDNDTLRLGAGSDFRMWFSGADTYFRNYAHANGDIIFQGETSAGTNQNILIMKTDGTSTYNILYENSAERFRTNSTGVKVSGIMESTGHVTLGGELNLIGTADANKYIDCRVGTNALNIRKTTGGDTGHETMARFIGDGGVELYHNNAKKFETTSVGATLYGTLNNNTTDSYDKIRVWDSSLYTIGMKSACTHGDLNDYAMTFTMSNENDRGFLWRDTNHSSAGGAMSLSCRGGLSVSRGINVGGGEADTGWSDHPLHVFNSWQTGQNNSYTTTYIDANWSGTAAFTANRTNVGLRVDQDNSKSNTTGANGNRHTTIGVSSTSDCTQYTHDNRGLYGFAKSTGAGNGIGTQSVFGAYTYAQGYLSSGAANIYGLHSLAYRGGSTSGGTLYGVYARAQSTTNGSGKSGNAVGGYFEVECDEDTIADAKGVQSHIDRDGGTITTGYLFYGSYAGTVGTKWGTYITGETQNYFSGNVGIGSTAPVAKLDVNGNIHCTKLSAGTAANPGSNLDICLGADSDTGFSVPSDGNLKFWCNNAEVSSWTSSTLTFQKAATFNGRVSIRGHLDLSDGENLDFGSSDDVRINYNSNNWLYTNFRTGNGIVFQDNGTDITVLEDSGVFRPVTNNTGSLGSSTRKWQNVYASTFTGALSGNATTATNATNATNATRVQITLSDGVSNNNARLCFVDSSSPNSNRVDDMLINSNLQFRRNTGTLTTTNLVATGSVSKGSGSFKIDHPLPSKTETHHLVHSFIEGPQADLIYRGIVDLVDGQATINIDTAARMTEGTFELLCTNVSCFTSNESDWTAVKGSVNGNLLTITAQDQTSTSKISWMVVGERKDQHMIDTDWTDEAGRVITEPEKVEEEE
jgi:hypothetical protein